MSVHDAWNLACRLFESGQPIRSALLSQADLVGLKALGSAVRPAGAGGGMVLCPCCAEHRLLVLKRGERRYCRCPECGPVEVTADDFDAWKIDDAWMHRSLRLALDIQSRDGINQLDDGVWRIGGVRRSPVVLSRNLMRVWKAPGLLDRVRVPGGAILLITPVVHDVYSLPFGADVQWLPLQERFVLYGGGISAIGLSDEPQSTPSPEPGTSADPTIPVHGPFSDDFRWVTVLQIQGAPIRLTPTQAAVFRALWQFKGQSVPGARVMEAAGSGSTKPGDLFKGLNYALARRVFKELVVIDDREGLYSMPCAKGVVSV